MFRFILSVCWKYFWDNLVLLFKQFGYSEEIKERGNVCGHVWKLFFSYFKNISEFWILLSLPTSQSFRYFNVYAEVGELRCFVFLFVFSWKSNVATLAHLFCFTALFQQAEKIPNECLCRRQWSHLESTTLSHPMLPELSKIKCHQSGTLFKDIAWNINYLLIVCLLSNLQAVILINKKNRCIYGNKVWKIAFMSEKCSRKMVRWSWKS